MLNFSPHPNPLPEGRGDCPERYSAPLLNRATFSPSPFQGEGRGEGISSHSVTCCLHPEGDGPAPSLTPLISGNQITSRKPPSGLSSALTHHDAAEWRFQQSPAPNLYRQITIACFIGPIERTENLFAIFGLTPGPSSSTVMVIPSLSTASPLQSSYGNNAEHYEQCFPGTFQGVRIAVQRPRPRREVNVNDLPICSASNAALSSTSLQTGWL